MLEKEAKNEEIDQFNQGKFTFEPNYKQPLHNAVGGANDIGGEGVSFGGANKFPDAISDHLSYSNANDASAKHLRSQHQSRQITE